MIQPTEISTVGNTSSVTVDQVQEVSFTGSTAVTGSTTTIKNNDLIYGAFASASGPVSAGAGYTQIEQYGGFWLTEWATQAAAGTIAVTATQSGTSDCTVLIAAFSPGSTGFSVGHEGIASGNTVGAVQGKSP
jgi:hypothetical protein